MALSWTVAFVFGLGLISTFSTIRNVYRLATGREDLNFTQIIIKHGYQSEHHTVQTEDGYLLTIFRITEAANCTKGKTKTPVLLMNGLLASADCFLDAGVKAGLPFLLSDACFDLWVGNARGTYYGRRHTTLNPDSDKEFWDFSVDEIGLHDVPATIDYVLNYTGAEKLNYVGISQGAGSFFVMCSERPGYCEKAKVLIGLAPATRHTNAKSIVFRQITTIIRDHEKLLHTFGFWEFAWKGFADVFKTVCQHKPEFCEAFIAYLDASHPGSISIDSLKEALEHFPAGTSLKNLARYGQSVNGERYCKFDYGHEKNMEIYGGDPPDFNLSAVSIPVVILQGKNDGIVDYSDVKWTIDRLPNVKEFVMIEDPLWNHLDMVIANKIPELLFPKILEYLLLYDGNGNGTTSIPES
ncbi:lipase 1-like [Choristoneura fumiferana]|uniref:lipase 1-like n=1 Tax=Choristoneura fumiferana TaxID=7141 RepID=UPI003D15EF42